VILSFNSNILIVAKQRRLKGKIDRLSLKKRKIIFLMTVMCQTTIPPEEEILTILKGCRTIAVVGPPDSPVLITFDPHPCDLKPGLALKSLIFY